ncbi:Pol polyprotein [Elysia marginata]|uniref:Pol polyprotein n=1 Tax=Elysia marginata TaxID=1093978 RepID=A0AAV4FD67_9GAST|nr:Pol polyprotein [Elysia marginata]
MDLVHRSGRQHGNADSLSRRPFQACVEATLESLPCGGCNYCRRIERKWIKFKEEVDDVIPLSAGTPPVWTGGQHDPCCPIGWSLVGLGLPPRGSPGAAAVGLITCVPLLGSVVGVAPRV